MSKIIINALTVFLGGNKMLKKGKNAPGVSQGIVTLNGGD